MLGTEIQKAINKITTIFDKHYLSNEQKIEVVAKLVSFLFIDFLSYLKGTKAPPEEAREQLREFILFVTEALRDELVNLAAIADGQFCFDNDRVKESFEQNAKNADELSEMLSLLKYIMLDPSENSI